MKSFATLKRGLSLTGQSIAYIRRNGAKPDGALRVCRAFIQLPEESLDLYRSLLQMETTKLQMPTEPRLILNFIEVADQGYREFQVMMRASYRGEERWYLNHILINNFFGWIYGLKDYGYNKYLYPVNYRFDDDNRGMDIAIPADAPQLLASFRADPGASPLEVDDDGSYSVKGNKLIYCKTGMSEIEEISLDHGVLDIAANTFEANRHLIDYPLAWSQLIPEGEHQASLFLGKMKDIGMEPLQVLETW